MLPLRLSRSRVSAMARVSSRSAKLGISKYAAMHNWPPVISHYTISKLGAAQE